MDDRELAQAVHRHLMHFNVVATELEGGATLERDGELFYADDPRFPFLSGVMRDAEGPGWEETLACAGPWFAERGCSYIVVLRPGDGDVPSAPALLERYPEMVVTEPIEPPPLAAGAQLRPVGDPASARAYWTVCATAYPSLGFPGQMFEEMSEALLLDERVTAVVAYLDSAPVAAALALVSDGLGMVAWVATVDEARRTGLGAAVTVAVTNEAFERGARAVHLQASPMGEAVYLRLGYRELFNYRLHASPPAPQD
jgi:GNAT superfamily N-acetyltransferase